MIKNDDLEDPIDESQLERIKILKRNDLIGSEIEYQKPRKTKTRDNILSI